MMSEKIYLKEPEAKRHRLMEMKKVDFQIKTIW